jgi:hypothetical protein
MTPTEYIINIKAGLVASDLVASFEMVLEYVETVLRYLSSASEHITGQDIQWALETSNFVEGERIMSTIAQEWIQQGIQEGEQRGLEEGRQEGLQQGLLQGVRQGLLEGIALGLELRFGSEGLRLLPEISRIHDVDILHAIHEGLKTAETLEELRRLYVVV